jgi:hypothetical protein
VQFNVQREKESMERYDKEGVDSIDFNNGMVRVTRVCNADTRFLGGMCA